MNKNYYFFIVSVFIIILSFVFYIHLSHTGTEHILSYNITNKDIILSHDILPDNYEFDNDKDYVPNALSAVRIAIVTWKNVYGNTNIIEESPFRVRLIDDSIWVVKGTLGGKNRDDIVLGGVFSVGLLKNGKILYLKHEK